MSLTVRIDWQYILSPVGVSVRTALTWKARRCVCSRVREVFSIYDNNIWLRLIIIIIKTIILYFIQITHTDDFPSMGTRLVFVIRTNVSFLNQWRRSDRSFTITPQSLDTFCIVSSPRQRRPYPYKTMVSTHVFPIHDCFAFARHSIPSRHILQSACSIYMHALNTLWCCIILSPGAAPGLLSQGRWGEGGTDEVYLEHRPSALLHASGDGQRQSVSLDPSSLGWGTFCILARGWISRSLLTLGIGSSNLHTTCKRKILF